MINSATITCFQRLICPVVIIIMLLVSTSNPGSAAEQPVGKVAAVAGKVTAAGPDGAIRSISQDAPIFAGDIVSTGPNSRVRIVFSDNGIIFLRPSTRFVVKSYSHNSDQKEDESKFSLIKGGFRSVTGAIGQANNKSHGIDTPVGTIGIRGTDHEGRYCADDCADLIDLGVAAPPDGLYTGTYSGKTVINGQIFEAGQYGFTNPMGKTLRLPEPPQILFKDPLLPGALTDKGAAKATDKNSKGVERQKSLENRTGTGDDGNVDNDDEKGFEIPAKTPTTQLIDCK